MFSIHEFKVVGDKKIHFIFSDGSEKTIDFLPFIGEDELSKPLSDPAYFRKAELLENGRGIYWPNDFDFCPDFLHQYEEDEKELISRKG
jgi:hypothetical protein